VEFSLNRRIYRLLSLYEIADDEFSSVNNALINHPDNFVYKMLRRLEGKIYKYAQIDYDRVTSIKTLRIILSYLSTAERNIVFTGINKFIQMNNRKIKTIFQENKNRYHEISILTQPEIFLIWFCLEQFPYSITEPWDNDFDPNDLEEIKNLWGSEI